MNVPSRFRPFRPAYLLLASVLAWGSGQADLSVPTSLEVLPLTTSEDCSGTFVSHTLDHTTTVPGDGTVRGFDANGAGVALGDLDLDGDLDIVLANHAGPNTLLWNRGGLDFRRETFGDGDARAAVIVDVDGDGRPDIVLSRRVGAPNYWRNLGDGGFALEVLPGIDKPLYAIGWADLDGDGDLDLVGGSYDAGLLDAFGNSFLLGSDAGVYLFDNRGDGFGSTRLAANAQALALALPDLNDDGRPDIVVGNDFGVRDMAWLASDDGWQPAAPFSATSHSTMSFDLGDIDNDGRNELFSTDMKPFGDDPATAAAWRPLMEAMASEEHAAGDPQIMANTLQRTGPGGFEERAVALGLDASGWSWSGRFGDLDRDGFLDLYVVNGMAEATIFEHLDGGELVEQNLAFRNLGGVRFEAMPGWNLGSRRGGRGSSMGDLDGDGDLDIVVNNLEGPAELFENRLCGGDSLQLDLRWPQSRNRFAIGAMVVLRTDAGDYRRDVRVGGGYLSGDPARLHFGMPAGATALALEIEWPDGGRSRIEAPALGGRLLVRRNGP